MCLPYLKSDRIFSDQVKKKISTSFGQAMSIPTKKTHKNNNTSVITLLMFY